MRKVLIAAGLVVVVIGLFVFGPSLMGLDAKSLANRPLFWRSGDDFLFPTHCKQCGSVLENFEDELSACRRCPTCDTPQSPVRYRHPSLPKTIEEQTRL